MDYIDAYSIEIRYTLDFMCYLLHTKQPRSVRIGSDSIELVKAVVRRLCTDNYRLFVDSEVIRVAVKEALGIEVEVAGDEPAETALLPFSLQKISLPCERTIIVAVRNTLSYKSLLYPGIVRTTAMGTIARVRRQYHVEQIVGIYPPRFIALLGLAHLAERWSPSVYFRLSDLAMQYLYEFNAMWRFSYVVIFAGQR